MAEQVQPSGVARTRSAVFDVLGVLLMAEAVALWPFWAITVTWQRPFAQIEDPNYHPVTWSTVLVTAVLTLVTFVLVCWTASHVARRGSLRMRCWIASVSVLAHVPQRGLPPAVSKWGTILVALGLIAVNLPLAISSAWWTRIPGASVVPAFVSLGLAWYITERLRSRPASADHVPPLAAVPH